MSLRVQLIEAVADELEKLADLRVGVGLKFAAEAALDTMLDVLDDSSRQFEPASFQLCLEDVVRSLRARESNEPT